MTRNTGHDAALKNIIHHYLKKSIRSHSQLVTYWCLVRTFWHDFVWRQSLRSNHNDTPNFYSIKLIAKIKLITKMNNWTYISVITTTLNDQNHISEKLYWKCNNFFYFDWSPIPLHGEGGVYDLYCSQPPGGDKRACSFIFKNEWDAPSPNQALICDDIGSENVLNTQAWLSKMPNNNDLKPKIKKESHARAKYCM